MNQNAQLLSNIATQLRSTLSTFYIAAAQLATPEQREEDPNIDACAAAIQKSYFQILRTINNLTLAGLYMNQKTPLSLQNLDIVELVYRICELSMGPAEVLGLHLRLFSPEETHICAANRAGIEEILHQLLSNAFKFTPSGGTVTVELAFITKDHKKQVSLSVKDTGKGIPEEYLGTLFTRYLSNYPKAPFPHGLGLGLALCHYIAQGHGGDIQAVSSEKKGSGATFTLTFPDQLSDEYAETVSDNFFDYYGGLNQTLLGLADAMPEKIYLQENLI